MPEAAPVAAPPPRVRLCASRELEEQGRAVLFDVRHHGEPMRAFALRHGGRVVAYLNRCVHVPTELDWNPGDFLDAERSFIVCSIHGATYRPADGRCVGGPCGGGRLVPLAVEDDGTDVWWQPGRDTRDPFDG